MRIEEREGRSKKRTADETLMKNRIYISILMHHMDLFIWHYSVFNVYTVHRAISNNISPYSCSKFDLMPFKTATNGYARTSIINDTEMMESSWHNDIQTFDRNKLLLTIEIMVLWHIMYWISPVIFYMLITAEYMA